MQRALFLLAASYNFGGIACLALPSLTQRLLLGEVLAGPSAMLWTDLWLFVVIMGVGNLMVAFDPVHNRGIAWMAAVGKALFAVHWLSVAALGGATVVLALGAAGDLVLAIAIGTWLWHSRTATASPE